jgi:glycerol-3-phosphate dehydrogenase
MSPQPFLKTDVLIVGGGINGAGIARDAAGRGLSVVLCEKDDLAAHTSSASTKLIHGGLRYLENYEFSLVRKALIEREVLLRSAPHIMWPMRFVMPHDQGQRPAWMIRAGLLLYDFLARREILPSSGGIDLQSHPAGGPLKPEFAQGFIYSDGWVDDARLVVLNALDAAERGAHIFTHTGCESARRSTDRWQATLRRQDGSAIEVSARCLVNAAGPWAASFLEGAVHRPPGPALRLIKGSHIVVKKMFDHPYAYIFQNPDGRIVFAINYEQDFTLVGTTDIEYLGNADQVSIDQAEIEYLCQLTERYFKKPLRPSDVVWSYSGVRPLLEDDSTKASEITRDYKLSMDAEAAPLLSVFGGKITTFRKLAEEAVDMIAPRLGNTDITWTEHACLPGGDLYGPPQNRAVLEYDAYVHNVQQQYDWLDSTLVARYVRAYGTRIHRLLKGRSQVSDMGEALAAGLYVAEIEYLVRNEWASSGEDILWRRSKLGLHLPADTAQKIDQWLLQKDTLRR